MNKSKIFYYLVTLLLVISVVFYIYELLVSKNDSIKVLKQNNASLSNGIKIIKDGERVLRQKYALVQEESAMKDKLLHRQGEQILNKNKLIMQLKKITENNPGQIITDGDSIDVPMFNILFSGKNRFYSYTDSVFVSEKPTHSLNLSFEKFSIVNYLTRNKDGLWSGYSEFEPSWVADYLDLADMEIIVSKDFYLTPEKIYWGIMPKLNILVQSETHFAVGVNLIAGNYEVGYSRFLNKNWHLIEAGYFLRF